MANKMAARLVIVIEYEEIPSKDAVNGLLDEAKGDGEVAEAHLEIKIPGKIDVTGGWQ